MIDVLGGKEGFGVEQQLTDPSPNENVDEN